MTPSWRWTNAPIGRERSLVPFHVDNMQNRTDSIRSHTWSIVTSAMDGFPSIYRINDQRGGMLWWGALVFHRHQQPVARLQRDPVDRPNRLVRAQVQIELPDDRLQDEGCLLHRECHSNAAARAAA